MADCASVDTSRLTSLFDVEHRARAAGHLTTLRFVAVNETRRVVDYAHAALIEPGMTGWRFTTVSDVASVDHNGLFAQWVERAFAEQKPSEDTGFEFDAEALGDWERGVWPDVSPASVRVVPRAAPGRAPAAWLWLASETPLVDGSASLIAHLSEVYGHALEGLMPRGQRTPWTQRLAKRRCWFVAIIVVLLLAAIPVRLSALAPAEIIAHDPDIVAAP